MTSIPALRSLGKSDLLVTPIGLGTWQFSKANNLAGKFWPKLDDDLIHHIVKISLEGGINWFDTAEVYGNGASELALASALGKCEIKPGEVTVATKWWPMFRFASSIRKTIPWRIENLSPYPIDLFQIHQPYGLSSEKDEIEAMATLVKENLIRYIGVSNFSAPKMRFAWETLQKQGIPLVSNQVRYSLLDRRIESNGILQTAKELGISIIAYSPLAQGLLTGKFHDDPSLLQDIGWRKYSPLFKPSGIDKSRPLINTLKELSLKYEATPSQIALNWLIHFHGESVVAIPGATKEIHARENTGAMSFILSGEDMARLDKESLIFR
jgi:aryl-alcohol dehydrogenase-like predicted oxidoreductase